MEYGTSYEQTGLSAQCVSCVKKQLLGLAKMSVGPLTYANNLLYLRKWHTSSCPAQNNTNCAISTARHILFSTP